MNRKVLVFVCLILLLSICICCVSCNKKTDNTPKDAVYHSDKLIYALNDEIDENAYITYMQEGKENTVGIKDEGVVIEGFSTDECKGMVEAEVTLPNGLKTSFTYFVTKEAEKLTDDTQTSYRNLAYGNRTDYKEDSNQLFDIFLPKPLKDITGDETVILYIHGGAWVWGSKSEAYGALVPALVQDGNIVISMEYKLAGIEVSVLDQYHDIGAMMAYLNSFLPLNGINVDKIAIAGYSAGGHLSAWYGYSAANVLPLKIGFEIDIVGPINVADEGYVNALNNCKEDYGDIIELFMEMFCGVVGIEYDENKDYLEDLDYVMEVLSHYSAMEYVDENSIPAIMAYAYGEPQTGEGEDFNPWGPFFTTQNDMLVPLSCYTNFKAKLDEYGVANVSRVFEGENHSTLVSSGIMIDWLCEQVREYSKLYL